MGRLGVAVALLALGAAQAFLLPPTPLTTRPLRHLPSQARALSPASRAARACPLCPFPALAQAPRDAELPAKASRRRALAPFVAVGLLLVAGVLCVSSGPALAVGAGSPAGAGSAGVALVVEAVRGWVTSAYQALAGAGAGVAGVVRGRSLPMAFSRYASVPDVDVEKRLVAAVRRIASLLQIPRNPTFTVAKNVKVGRRSTEACTGKIMVCPPLRECLPLLPSEGRMS
jgi:hypothetical protein